MNRYSEEFKAKVVAYYRNDSRGSFANTAKQFGISTSSVNRWYWADYNKNRSVDWTW